MKKKKLKIVVIVVIIMIVITLLLLNKTNTTSVKEQFISYQLFDKDHNPLTNTLSIVGDTSGVYYIKFLITIVNTGKTPITCNIFSLSPSAFNNGFNKIAQFVPSSGSRKASWLSDFIETSAFESETQATTFSVTAECYYTQNGETVYLPKKTGQLTLSILPEHDYASFVVSVIRSIDMTFCGDNVCSVPGENTQNCPEDCAIGNSIRFRTVDLTYDVGNAIAYSNTCGGQLTAYGKTDTACTNHFCDGSDYTLIVPTVNGFTKLWFNNPDVCICDFGQTSHTYPKKYTTSDGDAIKVDRTGTLKDYSREVLC